LGSTCTHEDLISTVLLRWHTLLASRLEHAVADEPDDRAQSVIGARRDALSVNLS